MPERLRPLYTEKSGIVICHCINMWEGGIRLSESIWKYFWYNIHELLKHGCCISFYFMGTFCDLWVRKPAWQRKEGASVKSIRYSYHFYFTFSEVPSFRLHEQVNNIYEKRGSQMKNRYLSTRIMAIMMAAAMAVSAAPAAFAAWPCGNSPQFCRFRSCTLRENRPAWAWYPWRNRLADRP